jgi:trigger factor
MNYSLQKSSKCQSEVTIDINKDEWEICIKDAYNKNKHKYRIEGFRAGKVPFSVMCNRYGKEIFYEEALDLALMKYYGEVLEKEENLNPVSRPKVDVKEVDENGVKILLEIETYPEFELGKYKGLKIEKFKTDVSDTEVNDEIDKKREQTARFVDVTDRACTKGDKVIIDYSGSVNGVKFDGGTAQNQELTLGSGSFIPGFEEQVEGMKIGDERDIKVKFPAEYHAPDLADKDAVFKINLSAIKSKELPALDDEFAKDVSEFDTLKEYKDSVKAKLTEAAEKKAYHEENEKIIDAIAETTEIDIPTSMVDEELDRIISELKARMRYSGLRFEDYLKYIDQTEDMIRADRAEEAKKSVKVRLIFEAIIKEEELKVEKEDIDNEIERVAKEIGKDIEEFKKTMREQDAGRMMNKIMVDKLFGLLRENNKIG